MASFSIFPWVHFLHRRLSLCELQEGVKGLSPPPSLHVVETVGLLEIQSTITMMRSCSCVVKLFPAIFFLSECNF